MAKSAVIVLRSESTKATALALLKANGGNVAKTARELGIPRLTLRDWSLGRGVNPEVLEAQHGKRKDLAARCEQLAWAFADAMPAKIGNATLSQVSTAFGTVIDKMRLLREQSTVITDNRAQIEMLIVDLSARYGKSADDIRRDLVKIRPETAAFVEVESAA